MRWFVIPNWGHRHSLHPFLWSSYDILFILKMDICLLFQWSHRSSQSRSLSSFMSFSKHAIQSLVIILCFWQPFLKPHQTTYHSHTCFLIKKHHWIRVIYNMLLARLSSIQHKNLTLDDMWPIHLKCVELDQCKA